ncbi:Cytochrome c domain-containing protein [Sulfidibacter corallicola]|uniref:Cytochrome c domain-containing protein n=1 Tax=Sulfidibacter corallicola TaxID=2818388 RepID=A0A8A4TX17_SULCO|nr:hypothetical protein [Sulfidibacter corallicola]QTD53512.1 hypothetical protein J3U87_13740 [Sulfidibacter corallicola]
MKSSLFAVFVFALLSAAGGLAFNLTDDPDEETTTVVVPLESAKIEGAYDPLALAMATKGQISNYEATVPPQCYTKTAGTANPCWTCHTNPQLPNELVDWELQEEYAFSDFAMTNRWFNLFKDRREAMAGIGDEEVIAYVRGENYKALRDALTTAPGYPGYVPDLDFEAGFDDEGFAKDGSMWRALRYKPFLGTFWPTNGSTDDVFIRLPEKFRTLDGKPSRDIYKANLSILEAVIAAGPMAGRGSRFVYEIEPLNEEAIQADLDGDGRIAGVVREIRGFPQAYVGDASGESTRQYIYPKGTEYLHSVRYLDPEAPGMTARRMKELRYSKKVKYLDSWGISYMYEQEYNEKEAGDLPIFSGGPQVGILNGFGWQLQGFIEDEKGRLRLQTSEEHQFCMGCHSAIGVTVDHTFTLARKVPGAEGWRYQNPTGLRDVPQQGHEKPEIATYFERVTGGDEFRANAEVLSRFFENGKPREAEIARAAPGGDKDITHLIAPSPRRALDLNRAYMAIVREQSFQFGRDALLGPIENVHEHIENGSTDLADTGKVFRDGRLWLDWRWQPPKGESTKRDQAEKSSPQ